METPIWKPLRIANDNLVYDLKYTFRRLGTGRKTCKVLNSVSTICLVYFCVSAIVDTGVCMMLELLQKVGHLQTGRTKLIDLPCSHFDRQPLLCVCDFVSKTQASYGMVS